MADSDELEYYDDEDIRDQHPDPDAGAREGGGEPAAAQRPPVRPLQTSSRQPGGRPPAQPPRPVPRRSSATSAGRDSVVPRPQGSPAPATSARPARTPPRNPARSAAGAAQPMPAPQQPQPQPAARANKRRGRFARLLRRRSDSSGRRTKRPGRLARLLRRKPRREERSPRTRRKPLRALRARLFGSGRATARPASRNVSSGGARRRWPALRLPFLRRRSGSAARAADATRKRRSSASKAPRLGGRGLTLDNKLDILGVLLLLASLALVLSSLSSIRGQVTQLINTWLGNLLGWGALAVPLALFAIGLWLIVRHFGSEAPVIDLLRLAGSALVYVGLLLLFQFVDSFNPDYSSIDLSDPVRLRLQLELSWNAGRGGGSAGGELYYLLVLRRGRYAGHDGPGCC